MLSQISTSQPQQETLTLPIHKGLVLELQEIEKKEVQESNLKYNRCQLLEVERGKLLFFPKN